MAKNLSYFMKPEQKEPTIVEFPAPERFVDENGKRVAIKIRPLSAKEIAEINENYTIRTVAKDKKGNPYIKNGEIVFKTEKDNVKATRHMIVEALVEPDLKDPEIMKFYGAVDVTDMPDKVFSTFDEYTYVQDCVMKVCGLIDDPDAEDEVTQVKN